MLKNKTVTQVTHDHDGYELPFPMDDLMDGTDSVTASLSQKPSGRQGAVFSHPIERLSPHRATPVPSLNAALQLFHPPVCEALNEPSSAEAFHVGSIKSSPFTANGPFVFQKPKKSYAIGNKGTELSGKEPHGTVDPSVDLEVAVINSQVKKNSGLKRSKAHDNLCGLATATQLENADKKSNSENSNDENLKFSPIASSYTSESDSRTSTTSLDSRSSSRSTPAITPFDAVRRRTVSLPRAITPPINNKTTLPPRKISSSF